MENQRERAVHDTRAKLFEHECNALACIHARVKRDKGWRDTVWKGAGVGMREFECTPIELRAQEFPNSPNFRRRWNSKCSYKVSCEAMRHRGTEWVSKRNRQRERRGGGVEGIGRRQRCEWVLRGQAAPWFHRNGSRKPRGV